MRFGVRRITSAFLWGAFLVSGAQSHAGDLSAACELTFARIGQKYSQLHNAERAVSPLLEEIRDHFKSRGASITLSSRYKRIDSITEKIVRRENAGRPLDIDQMDDILGYRFVVGDPDEVRFVAASVQNALGKGGRIQNASNLRGYEALHVNGALRDGSRFEVQIMTRRMERWSSWDHDRVYKPVIESDEYRARLREYSKAVSDYLRALDHGGTPPSRPYWESFGLSHDDAFPSEFMK